jgi:hypothetical protein
MSTQFNSAASKLISRQAGVSKLDSTQLNSSLWPLCTDHAENKASPFSEGVFTAPFHSNGSYSIVVCVFVAAGMCSPSRCLEMNVYSDFTILAFGCHVTVFIYWWFTSAIPKVRDPSTSQRGCESFFQGPPKMLMIYHTRKLIGEGHINLQTYCDMRAESRNNLTRQIVR